MFFLCTCVTSEQLGKQTSCYFLWLKWISHRMFSLNGLLNEDRALIWRLLAISVPRKWRQSSTEVLMSVVSPWCNSALDLPDTELVKIYRVSQKNIGNGKNGTDETSNTRLFYFVIRAFNIMTWQLTIHMHSLFLS